VAIGLPLLPLFANSFGWIFTEMGRQPWLVFGLMTTPHGVSPGTTAGEVATSLGVFTVLYGVLAVVEVGLLVLTIRSGAEPFVEPPAPTRTGGSDEDAPMAFAY
jgi:cytochrome d ubiquinol oxidase subunit I